MGVGMVVFGAGALGFESNLRPWGDLISVNPVAALKRVIHALRYADIGAHPEE